MEYFLDYLNIVNIIGNSNNDFYLYSFLEQTNINAIFYYDFSNYSKLNGYIKFINEKPIISARYNLWGGFENTISLSEKLNNLPKDPYSQDGYSLIAVHNWSNSVDSILQCVSLLNEDIRVVSPDKFINLINQNITEKSNELLANIKYPNPTKDYANVDVRANINEIIRVELAGINGKEIIKPPLQTTYKEDNLTSINIDLTNLNTGTYFVVIETNNSKGVAKIVKIE